MGSMRSVNTNSQHDDSRSGIVTNVPGAVDEMENSRSVIRNSQKRTKISNADEVCSSPTSVVHEQAKEISNTNALRSSDPAVCQQHAANRISNADVVPCSPSSVVYDPHVSRRTSTADYCSPDSVVCDQDVATRFSNAAVCEQDAGKRNLDSDAVLHKSKPEPMEFSNFQWRQDVCNSSVVPIKQEQVQHYQNINGKRNLDSDIFLYKFKPEPMEFSNFQWRKDVCSSSVVPTKQEQMQHYQYIHDRCVSGPVAAERLGTLGRCLTTRKLILTALDTFEQVRKQIIKDPSYGQTILEPQGPQASNQEGADMKAASLMLKKGFWLNDKVRPIGEVPGVVVGDRFRYRIEMAIIGLHRAVQADIGVVSSGYSPYGVTVASSVVIDDNNMGDTVVYSEQGLCGKTEDSQDQKLQRGNLALSNSFNLKLPVRLIRGHKKQNRMTGILHSYDGLYNIIEMNYVEGVNGKKVYTFTMHRLPGQAPIFPGYPVPVGLQPPPAREPTQHAADWTESAQTLAGQHTENAVYWTESAQTSAGQHTQNAVYWTESSPPPAGQTTQPTQNVVH